MRLVQGTTAEDGNSHEKGLAVLGLQLQHPCDDEREFRLWPENEQAASVFGHMVSQFRVTQGFKGLCYHGLRYEVLPHVCRALRIGPGRQRRIFPALQTMEAAALEALNAEG